MKKELEETLRLIIERVGDNNRIVFIPMRDFSWYNHRNGQLSQLYYEGLITKPIYCDNGVLVGPTDEGRNYLGDETNEIATEQKNHDKPSIFVSYNHGSTEIVEKLVAKIDSYADAHWDRNVGPWESFNSFMDTIRKQDYAVLIISDAYLKSKACLHEVIQLMSTDNWDNKAMYIVENNARKIFDVLGRVEYIDYWDSEETKLQNEMNKHCIEVASELIDEISEIKEIKSHIGAFMKKVADANNPDVSDAIAAIVERMKISAKRSSASDIESVILTLLRNEEMSTFELSVALNRAESTIRRHLYILIEKGLVIKKANGRSYIYQVK